MQRTGPTRFTLALVAKEAGLSPAALVQRFGSKQKLLHALVASGGGYGPFLEGQLRAKHDSPLRVAREFLLCFAELARTPKEMANHLAWLQLDLTDPVMHRHLLEVSKDNQSIVAGLLDEAVAAGELQPNDTQALARVLNALVTGGLLAWATFRRGSARAWLEQDLDFVLAQVGAGRRARGARLGARRTAQGAR